MRPDNTWYVYQTRRVKQAQRLIPLVEDRCKREDRHFIICHNKNDILFCIQGPFHTKHDKQIVRCADMWMKNLIRKVDYYFHCNYQVIDIEQYLTSYQIDEPFYIKRSALPERKQEISNALTGTHSHYGNSQTLQQDDHYE